MLMTLLQLQSSNNCLEAFKEEKLVLDISGELGLYDFRSCDYCDLNKKHQTSVKIFTAIVSLLKYTALFCVHQSHKKAVLCALSFASWQRLSVRLIPK